MLDLENFKFEDPNKKRNTDVNEYQNSPKKDKNVTTITTD